MQFMKKMFRPTMALTGLLILLSLLLAGCGAPSSYQCGTPSGGHCSGYVNWNQSINGSQVAIENVTLTGAVDTNSFMTNEMWLTQNNNSTCAPIGGATVPCWVEAGFTYMPGHSSNDTFFWAQDLPNKGFTLNFGESFPSNDFFSTFTIDRTDKSTVRIAITVPADDGSNLIYDSTNNTLAPDQMIIGMELEGTHGAIEAPTAAFENPGWFDTGNTFNVESSDGTVSSDNPPSGSWYNAPSSGKLPIFQTSCC